MMMHGLTKFKVPHFMKA